jgi:hypothetical protein
MFSINNNFSFISQAKESRFLSQATKIQETISEIGQDALEALKTHKQIWVLTGGLLTMGAVYTGKLFSCIQEGQDANIETCHQRFVADGINDTMVLVATATALAVGVGQYLAIRRQTTVDNLRN